MWNERDNDLFDVGATILIDLNNYLKPNGGIISVGLSCNSFLLLLKKNKWYVVWPVISIVDGSKR